MSLTIRQRAALRDYRTPRTRKEAGIMLDDITEDRGAGLISALVLLVCVVVTAAVLWGACVLLFSVDTDPERTAEMVRMHREAAR